MLQKMREMRDEKGFTLIELLVVVVILVVLAAVAVPIFLGQKGKAEDASNQSTLGAVATVLKNGAAVGSNVGYTDATTTLAYTGDAGDQNINLSGANLYNFAGGAQIVANLTPVPSTWCITKGSFQMTAADTTPVAGDCS